MFKIFIVRKINKITLFCKINQTNLLREYNISIIVGYAVLCLI